MTRCLVVDDDLEIRSAVQQFLQGFGIGVSTAGDGREMRRTMASNRFDVVVLDLMLPDEDGLSLCKWVQQTADVPVIMLTAQSDPISRIVGLEMGADDYLGKPFEPRELVARIHAVLRREHKREARATAGQVLAFEGWRFDRVRRRLQSPQGVLVELSNAEFRLLSALVERPGRVLTREQLIELTRAPGVDVNDRSIDLAISRLRQKLGDSPKNPRLIRTLRGEGYLFDVAVGGAADPAPLDLAAAAATAGAAAMTGWFVDTLAKRLFGLMCVALVGSHLVAFAVVRTLHAEPAAGGRGMSSFDELPTFPSLPPTPGVPQVRGGAVPPPPPDRAGPPPPDGAPPGGGPALPLDALLLDYGVRFAVMAIAAWFGSRWLALPMQRLVQASRSLGSGVAGAAATVPLDERRGTREVRETARVFNEMAAELRQQFRSRGLMVAAISHDLRTPLTRLRMRLQNDGRMAPELRQRSVDDIREMSALIDNVLDVFRLDAGAASAGSDPAQPLDVDALVQARVDDLAEQGQPVTYDGSPAVALAQPAALSRVVDNLVGNALRYGERADLRLRVADGVARLTVDDAGPGIAEAELDAVFEPFYRVEASRNRHTGGSGLGLYIARELTRRQRGTLTLANPAGGLRAELTLPLHGVEPRRSGTEV